MESATQNQIKFMQAIRSAIEVDIAYISNNPYVNQDALRLFEYRRRVAIDYLKKGSNKDELRQIFMGVNKNIIELLGLIS